MKSVDETWTGRSKVCKKVYSGLFRVQQQQQCGDGEGLDSAAPPSLTH